jgi:hypothetical protein
LLNSLSAKGTKGTSGLGEAIDQKTNQGQEIYNRRGAENAD